MTKINSITLEDQKASKVDAMCVKHDRYARDCKHNKSQNEANVVQVDDSITAIMNDIMAIKGGVQGLWYDTCGIVHVS